MANLGDTSFKQILSHGKIAYTHWQVTRMTKHTQNMSIILQDDYKDTNQQRQYVLTMI